MAGTTFIHRQQRFIGVSMFLLANQIQDRDQILIRDRDGLAPILSVSYKFLCYLIFSCFSQVATISKEAVSFFSTRQAVATATNNGAYFANGRIQYVRNKVVISKRFHTVAQSSGKQQDLRLRENYLEFLEKQQLFRQLFHGSIQSFHTNTGCYFD